MAQVIKNRIVKTILWFSFSLLLLLFVTATAIQFPYIQTKLVNYISTKYSLLLGYDIKLEKIAIKWFDSVELSKITITDPEKNTMIYAKSIFIDFDIPSLLDKENHQVDEIIINGSHVYLTKLFVEDDSLVTLNINHFIRKIRSLNKKESTGSRSYISSDDVKIKNSKFSYNDQARDSLKGQFDYYHFSLDSINADLENVFTVRDTFGLESNRLTTVDVATGLKLKRLKTHFQISQSGMLFHNLDLHAGNSIIKDSVAFEYSSTLDLSDFNNKVKLVAHLDKTQLSSQDLKLFAPQMGTLNEKFNVSGDFEGYVRSFVLRNAHLTFGNGTSLRGKIRMTGLPNFQETFIDFDLVNSHITTADFSKYVKPKTYARLEPFEYVSFSAEFIGFPNDFVATGNFFTEYGRINSDINLKLEEDISQSTYSGNLGIKDFDMGGYSNSEKLGILNLSGNIKGRGFTIETADFKLNGEIEKIGINDYEYVNIKTNARFTKEFFEGEIAVNDPNLKLDVAGSIDMRGGLNFFNLKAQLDTVNLKTLNLTKEDLFVKSKLDVNARGIKVDEILGAANLVDTYVFYRGNSLHVDSLSVISDRDEEERIVLLNSNLFNLKASGEFDFTQVYSSLKELVKEYELSLQNDSELITNYYNSKEQNKNKDYLLRYDIQIKDLNPLLMVFAPNVTINTQSKISGSLTGGYTSIFSMETKLDSLTIDNNHFVKNDIQINISKISDSTNVLAMVYLASDHQSLSNINTKNLLFEGIWNNKHIDFEFDIYQVDFENRALLFGSVDFYADTTTLKFETSDLQILDKQWSIANNNLFTFTNDEIFVRDFNVSNDNQRLAVSGALSKDQTKKLMLQVDNLELNNLNTIINKDIEGVVNGFGEISNYYGQMQFENNFNITEFKIDDFLIGDVKASSQWNSKLQESSINCSIRRLGLNVLSLKGKYSPEKVNQLDLIALLQDTELKIIEPFLDSYFTQFKGTLDGEIAITGELTRPLINGNGKIKNAGLHINYLNTDYQLSGGFYFTDTKIGFQNLDVVDVAGSHGAVNGYISHNNFKEMGISLVANINNFQVLNTTSKDNSLFYGNGVATGSINFFGPLSNMNIMANARTEKGTRIYIPIGDSESIEKEEYINFVDLTNNSDQSDDEVIRKIDLRGLKLDFDLDITPDAYCEIIFDIKSGDIIRGRGYGDLKLSIDTKGEFNMFGDYNIQEGGYNFTLYNLINKEFEILQNSKISWYGDPYQGVLDINASYNQLASFLPLLTEQQVGQDLSEVVEIRRKYPVNVLLEIDGALLSPTVNFDITTTTLPRNIQTPNGDPIDLEFEFLKFKNSIDEQELKRQVFSLIVLRKFSPLQSFNTGGSITSSVSELLSNQLSYWVTQVDENLEIDVDFGKLDEDAFNTFQLRLSYSFFDGRLRVTRDGGFTNQANRADVSSIAGDWTVEYLLSNDGKFKVKMYNRTNYNPINPTEQNQNTVTTGFSIIHTQSFDKIMDLFKRSREETLEELPEEREEEIPNNTTSSSEIEGVIREDEMD